MFIANYFFKTVDHQFRFAPPSHEVRSGPSSDSKLYRIQEDASLSPSSGEGEGGDGNHPLGRRLSLHQVTDSAGSSDSADGADSAGSTDVTDSSQSSDSEDGTDSTSGNEESFAERSVAFDREPRDENERPAEWSEDRAALVVMQLRLRALEARVAFLSESFAMLRDGREAASGDKSKKKRRISSVASPAPDEAAPRQYSFGIPERAEEAPTKPEEANSTAEDCQAQIEDCKAQTEDCKAQTEDCQAQTEDCKAQTEDYAPSAEDYAQSAENTEPPLEDTTPSENKDANAEDADLPDDNRVTRSDETAPPVEVNQEPCDCD
jgi:hypothetical protein